MVYKAIGENHVEPSAIDIESPKEVLNVLANIPAVLLAYGF